MRPFLSVFLFIQLMSGFGLQLQAQLGGDSLPPFSPLEWELGSEGKSGVSGNFSVNSTGLTAAFYRPFVVGGHIGEGLKRRTMEGMEDVNRFGGDRILSLGGSVQPDSLFGEKNEGQRLFFKLSDGRHYHARFTRDLFRTIFYGNSDADRYELAPFRMNSMRYRQFKVGVLDQRGAFEFGVAISAVQGVSDLRVRVNEGVLENEGNGEELGLRFEGRVRQQGQESSRPFSGVGGTIDILAGYDLGSYGRVRASFTDMGLLNWGPDARIYSIDTNLRFRGFRTDELLEGGFSGTNAPMDSVQERYFSAADTGSYRSFFPGTFRLAYSKRFPSGVWFRTSLLQRSFAAHAPFVNLEGMKRWERLRLGLSVGHGGYGEFAFGAMAGLRIGEHWDLYLRSRHLEGLFIPEGMGGVAAQMGIHYHY